MGKLTGKNRVDDVLPSGVKISIGNTTHKSFFSRGITKDSIQIKIDARQCEKQYENLEKLETLLSRIWIEKIFPSPSLSSPTTENSCVVLALQEEKELNQLEQLFRREGFVDIANRMISLWRKHLTLRDQVPRTQSYFLNEQDEFACPTERLHDFALCYLQDPDSSLSVSEGFKTLYKNNVRGLSEDIKSYIKRFIHDEEKINLLRNFLKRLNFYSFSREFEHIYTDEKKQSALLQQIQNLIQEVESLRKEIESLRNVVDQTRVATTTAPEKNTTDMSFFHGK